MPRGEKRVPIVVQVSLALKTALELEAFESQHTLSSYVRGLLERRGKWARTMGTAGGYDIQAVIPKVER